MAKSEKIYKAILLTVVSLIGVVILIFTFMLKSNTADAKQSDRIQFKKIEENTEDITTLKVSVGRIEVKVEDIPEFKSDVKDILRRMP